VCHRLSRSPITIIDPRKNPRLRKNPHVYLTNNWKFLLLKVLNKGTELDDPLELSLQERMNLSVKNFTWLLMVAVVLTVLSLIIGLLVILAQQIDYVDQQVDIQSLAVFLCFMTGGFLVWNGITGRKHNSENLSIIREYTHQSYLITLSVTNRTKDDDASMNFFNDVARNVFPEIKLADIESIKKSDEEIEVEELTLEDEKKGDYTFDVVFDYKKTIFLVKDFKKNKATYDDLEECLSVAIKEFGNKILRLVYLAEDFDSSILKNYQKLSDISKAPPLDLILYNEKGFSTLKVSNVTPNLYPE